MRRRWPRVGVLVLGTVAGILLLAFALSDVILNAWVLPALTRSAAVRGIDLLPGRLRTHLATNTFVLDSLVLRVPVSSSRLHVEAVLSAVTIRGFHWLTLVRGDGPSVQAIEIGRARLHAVPMDSGAATAAGSGPEGLQARFRIGRLTIHGGSAGMQAPAGGLQIDTLQDFSCMLEDLEAGGSGPGTLPGILARAVIRAGHARLTLPSARYGLACDSLLLTPGEGLRLQDIVLHPVAGDSSFFRQARYGTTRFDVRAALLSIPRWEWDEDSSSLSIGSVQLDSVSLNMLANSRKPADPAPGAAAMPNQMLARLPLGLSIDSLVLRRGVITYAEIFPHDRQPAVLHWTGFSVRATGIANRPASAPPARVEARGALMGGGPMVLRMGLPCADTTFSMTYEGSLRAMLLPLLNRWVTVSDRVRLTSGWCDSAVFAVTIRRGSARGEVRPAYAGLDVEMLDKETGRNTRTIKTFLANALRIRHVNPEPGEALKTGRIERRHAPQEPFFGFLWMALRGGLGSVVGF